MTKEDVIKAFVAKHGFVPERYCLLVEHTKDGTKERMLRVTDDDFKKASTALTGAESVPSNGGVVPGGDNP